MTYEYDYFNMSETRSPDEIKAKLNELGAKGWRAIYITSGTLHDDIAEARVWLMREGPSEQRKYEASVQFP